VVIYGDDVAKAMQLLFGNPFYIGIIYYCENEKRDWLKTLKKIKME